ncbi:hypothetical protein [Thiohalorhabdus methylotrophus]|uniref:Uncharacterized protein n=1 Tax=Thiohalorhabdus methylotrophus TaxID=3242694 RepID=A0ABV4TRP8_9GAMM
MPTLPRAALSLPVFLVLFCGPAAAEPDSSQRILPTFDVMPIGKGDADLRARALNDQGVVVGNIGTVWTAPWRWKPGAEEVTVLPFLPKWKKAGGDPGGNPVAKVRDINDRGTAVGSGGGDYSPEQDPVSWDAEGQIRDLGELPGAAREGGAAEKITPEGAIYGWTWGADGRKTRFRWTEEVGMEPHPDALPNDAPSPTERWVRQALSKHALGTLVDPADVPEFPVEEKFQPGREYFDDLRIQDINGAGQIIGWKKGLLGRHRSYLLTPRGGPAEGSDAKSGPAR